MTTLASWKQRTHALAHRAAALPAELRSPQRTALHVPADRWPPPRTAFAHYGDRTYVVPPTRVTGAEAIAIGDDVIILEDSGLSVDSQRGARLVIGDRTRLAVGVEISCSFGVTIGKAVSSSDYVSIVDAWSPARGSDVPSPGGAPVTIGDGAYLGWGCIVGPGVNVGAGAFVGEGSVVLDDVEPHTVVYGNPARVVRRRDESAGTWVGTRFP